MKKALFLMLISVFVIISSGCGNTLAVEPLFDTKISDKPIKIMSNQFNLLQEASDQTLKGLSTKVISVEEVYQKVVIEQDLNYSVVDLRSPSDYAKGTIQGAVNIPYELAANPKLLSGLPKDKTIVLVCYTGHMAGQTSALWNMLGYNAVAMINGMSGWTTKSIAGSTLPKSVYNFPVSTITPASTTFELPTFEKEKVSDLESLILAKSTIFLESKKGTIVKAEDLKVDLNNDNPKYFVVDIRNQEDYAQGHITGAINIPYENIAEKENLIKLPTDKTIVLVGYNGTDASQVARIINQLGYDSFALQYGMRIWTSNEIINGIAPISTESVSDLPTVELQYNLDSAPSGSASCG